MVVVLRSHTFFDMTKFPVLPDSDIPWTQLLQHIPFADNVCVAGSVGTWFAQLALTGSTPSWSHGHDCKAVIKFGAVMMMMIDDD